MGHLSANCKNVEGHNDVPGAFNGDMQTFCSATAGATSRQKFRCSVNMEPAQIAGRGRQRLRGGFFLIEQTGPIEHYVDAAYMEQGDITEFRGGAMLTFCQRLACSYVFKHRIGWQMEVGTA